MIKFSYLIFVFTIGILSATAQIQVKRIDWIAYQNAKGEKTRTIIEKPLKTEWGAIWHGSPLFSLFNPYQAVITRNSKYFDINRSNQTFISDQTKTIRGLNYKFLNGYVPTKELSDIFNSHPQAKIEFDNFNSLQHGTDKLFWLSEVVILGGLTTVFIGAINKDINLSVSGLAIELFIGGTLFSISKYRQAKSVNHLLDATRIYNGTKIKN